MRRQAPAIDPLIYGAPLDAEVGCHFNDRQPTILHNLLFCSRYKMGSQCGLLFCPIEIKKDRAIIGQELSTVKEVLYTALIH
jgi:hypothetical protein